MVGADHGRVRVESASREGGPLVGAGVMDHPVPLVVVFIQCEGNPIHDAAVELARFDLILEGDRVPEGEEEGREKIEGHHC